MGFHHKRVGFWENLSRNFRWMVDVDLEMDIGVQVRMVSREKTVRRWDTTTFHSPNSVSERASYFMLYIYFSMLKKGGCMQVCMNKISSLFFWFWNHSPNVEPVSPGFPTRWVRGPHDGHRRPMKRWSVEEFYEGNHWMRWPFIGASQKMGPQQIREDPIRKEGQTVKKRGDNRKRLECFFSSNFFPPKADSDISASSKVALNWSLRKNLVHNPLVPEFFSTIIMRTSIKWTHGLCFSQIALAMRMSYLSFLALLFKIWGKIGGDF